MDEDWEKFFRLKNVWSVTIIFESQIYQTNLVLQVFSMVYFDDEFDKLLDF